MYRVFYVCVYLISCLPTWFLSGIASFVRIILGNTFKYRYSVIIQNISRSFPKMGYGEVKSIADKYYKHMFNLIVEVVKLTSASEKKMRKMVVFENIEIINDPQFANRNIILSMGHYSNWEALNIMAKICNHKMIGLYSNISSSYVNKLMIDLRTKFGNSDVIEISSAPRYMLKNKNNPVMYLFLSDQSAPRSAMVCRFLNQDSYINSGMEYFAKKLDAKVFFARINPVNNKYYVRFEAIDGENITQGYLDKLQESIEKAPQYWLWSHKRWKYYP